jgi:glycosyltransferase involved in cell wall biosynthesis
VLTFLFKPRKTVVLFFHRTGTEAVKKYGPAGMVPLLMEKLVLHAARNFITLTDSMAAEILASRPKVRAKAGYVSFDMALLSDNTTDERFILCFGRIDIHMKGIDILIPAFEKVADAFPEHKLIVAGRGTETDTAWLRKRIYESPFRSRIECIVNASDEEKRRLFCTATFVCMPSRYEGWNIAALEAAALGKATIGTHIHGLQDAIRDNETGLLVQPENVDELARKMQILLSNVDLREKLGANGRMWARRFTLDRVAGIQEEFYNELYLANKT